MNKEYDVVIVGGGIAGLSCAAYSCKYGYRTLLLEKSAKTGGLVNTFWHEGYAFDGGIRAFENTGIVLPMLKNLGIDIETVNNPVSIGIGNKWTRLKSRDSLKSYIAMLISIFPEDKKEIIKIGKEIKKVMKYMDVIYGIDNPLFREDFTDKDYLFKTLFPWLLKYQMNIGKIQSLSKPVNTYLKQITHNKALIDMITQHFFTETPTFFALSYFGLYLEYFYPKGGTGVLTDKIADYIKQNGGEIITNAAVTHVDNLSNQVIAAGKTYSYKKLVWAANQKTLYKSLVHKDSVQINNQTKLVSSGKGNDSILSVFLGLDIDPEQFRHVSGAHAFYTPVAKGLSSIGSWQRAKNINDLLINWVNSYLKRTTYEISIPALRDSSLAPQGKTGLIISTLMDYKLVKHISDLGKYDDFNEFCMNNIIDIISHKINPEIKDKVEVKLCSTPLTIERITENFHGAITGWSFTNQDMPSENNFKKITDSIKTPIDDVYQCGQWTFSPSGMPVSILTGKVAADEVDKTLKSKG